MDNAIARRRLQTQWLSPPGGTSARDVVGHLLCVQAENPSQSAWAVAARTTTPLPEDLAGQLASGAVLRTHVLRPTWHYVLREDADWLLALTGPRVRPVVDRQLTGDLGFTEPELATLGEAVHAALASTPDLTRGQLHDALRDAEPALADRLRGQALMLLMARLELDRVVCSGRPTDGEHTYATWEDRVGARTVLTDGAPPERDDALGRLALRYLAGHGPATAKDLAYWATLTLGEARRGVEVMRDRLASFEHAGRTYWHLAGEPPTSDAAVEPAGHLLQLLDELYRGYQDSRWVLDADGVVPRLRESAIGMALVDAQLVGSMRRSVQRTRVRFDIAPYRPLSAGERAALDDAAARYGRFLGLPAEVVLAT